MAAEVLATAGASVTIIDHMAAPARKFLLAGRGGLNLTHSEPLEQFLTRYGEARAFLEAAIRAYPPQAVIDWCHGLGVETFVGTSGRVFPTCMKGSPVLRAWLRRLDGLGVTLRTHTEWQGFDGTPTILAMGGASWPHLGSSASWVPLLENAGITVHPFKPANSRFLVPWTEHFASRFSGQPVKNVKLSYGPHTVRGEIMISKDGIEGGAIYALSRSLRDEPGQPLVIDLRPDLSEDAVAVRLAARKRKDSASNFYRKAFNLTPVAIGLMREAHADNPKSVAIRLAGPAGLARAISSAGGIARSEVDAHFQLRKMPGCYAVGEMLDWEAPTGGYLLQACFSTAVAAARHLMMRLT
jgi:hypothetical protein